MQADKMPEKAKLSCNQSVAAELTFRLCNFIGCEMIRLTVLLCGGLFAVLLIAGQDKGQLRQGLETPAVLALVQEPAAALQAPEPVEPVAKISEAVFVPTQPVRVLAAVPTRVIAQSAPPEAEPENRWATVTARSANVRSGPSTSNAVIGRLSGGEQVMFVIEDDPVSGWNLVRIEGDGVEGYVAARLLQPIDP